MLAGGAQLGLPKAVVAGGRASSTRQPNSPTASAGPAPAARRAARPQAGGAEAAGAGRGQGPAAECRGKLRRRAPKAAAGRRPQGWRQRG
jgi:hypothetical protein